MILIVFIIFGTNNLNQHQDSMFNDATVFNQNISAWDVSKGIYFVSDDQALQLLNLIFLVLADAE
jgi:uncharacterized protein (DUF1015 family)